MARTSTTFAPAPGGPPICFRKNPERWMSRRSTAVAAVIMTALACHVQGASPVAVERLRGRQALPWRVGRKVGRTIYAQAGDAPSDDDELIGLMDTPALAREAVAGHNIRLKAWQLWQDLNRSEAS